MNLHVNPHYISAKIVPEWQIGDRQRIEENGSLGPSSKNYCMKCIVVVAYAYDASVN